MMIKDAHRFYDSRSALFIAVCVVIVVGLALRRYGYTVGLPFIVVKYGGSVLWGSMVYLLVATILPRRKRGLAVAVACVVAIVVEAIRLVHFPALDAFRATTSGALLLGRVFSLWNIVSYGLGIAMAALIAQRFLAKERPCEHVSGP
ncbi:DUF2809 domain-containing protein [Agrobacterium vaccinii]|uniref:ribosomal maturation YjgA family protein n=1 Tax=Agrobacterium vaccinii TaxID=2735528 RepID=UPI003BB1362E